MADVRRVFAPSIKALPFVARRDGARVTEPPLSWWKDTPGADHHSDCKRGRSYALLVIDALAADRCGSPPLENIFAAIIEDAVRRRLKGGKHARTLPPAVDGFLWELSRFIAGRVAGPGR
ncbi:MAG: hypothetical protein M3Z35_11145 [Nitrospirota bacterium]|nr:hypothetical protein [Nitrospirota bacterium]